MSAAEPLPPPRYEGTDGLPVAVVTTGIGLALGIALVLASSIWIYRASYGDRASSGTLRRESFFQNGAQAQTGIDAAWAEQDAAVRAHLQTYGWVDQRAGVVRIPIARAMELMAREAAAPRDQNGMP